MLLSNLFYKCRWCFERFVLERGIPSFGWKGILVFWGICSAHSHLNSSSYAWYCGLFEWRVNPWSGAIWLIWTVLAKAKTTTTHRLKFLKNVFEFWWPQNGCWKFTIVFSRSLRYTFSIHTSSKNIISSWCFYSWLENTGKEFSLLIVLRP